MGVMACYAFAMLASERSTAEPSFGMVAVISGSARPHDLPQRAQARPHVDMVGIEQPLQLEPVGGAATRMEATSSGSRSDRTSPRA